MGGRVRGWVPSSPLPPPRAPTRHADRHQPRKPQVRAGGVHVARERHARLPRLHPKLALLAAGVDLRGGRVGEHDVALVARACRGARSLQGWDAPAQTPAAAAAPAPAPRCPACWPASLRGDDQAHCGHAPTPRPLPRPSPPPPAAHTAVHRLHQRQVGHPLHQRPGLVGLQVPDKVPPHVGGQLRRLV